MLAKKHWWKVIVWLLAVGASGVLFMGIQTYQSAPPIVDFVDDQGAVVVGGDAVTRGQTVFQKYALMQYGTVFGDGGARGPDFSAEALHTMALSLGGEMDAESVRRLLKENSYDSISLHVVIAPPLVRAWHAVLVQNVHRFTAAGFGTFQPSGYLTDPAELRDLASFFFWSAWVCVTPRPGTQASYTHNWPYDPLAGNTLTPSAILWSVVGAMVLMLALGWVLYLHGRQSRAESGSTDDMDAVTTSATAGAFVPTPTQRTSFLFLAIAVTLFLVQVLAGVLTVHDFVGLTSFFGLDIQRAIPLPVSRSWHVQLAVQWIATCWIAGSLFILPQIAGHEPPRQLVLVRLLLAILVVMASGTLIGIFLGPLGLLGNYWQLLGNQGWEFVELGRLWQVLLFGALVLWAIIVWRGIRPALDRLQPFALPNWLGYGVTTICVLFLSSFVAGPETNFVIADFWRWMVIHMWAECFFEVFTTVIIAFYLVHMGLVGRDSATRIVFFATVLFCGSGFLGIAHNFYWNAKPEVTLAIGSVFSTLQVVPLLLLTLETSKLRSLPARAMRNASGTFGQSEAFLFLLGVNFWNFLGAGAFGFVINLPVINYFEHGTYLTVNHGHAALMGVYGNLSLGAMLYCARLLVRPERWNAPLLRFAFWSLNLGLVLTVVLDLLPAGILQFQAVLEHGLWYARSETFIKSQPFQLLTWMRLLGGGLFVVGGVLPLVWFMLTRLGSLKATTRVSA